MRALTAPTLLLWGDRDRSSVFAGGKANELLPSARLVVMKNCGHFPQFDAPHEFAEHVAEHLT